MNKYYKSIMTGVFENAFLKNNENFIFNFYYYRITKGDSNFKQ